MSRVSLPRILIVAIVGVSAWNAAVALHQFWHWPAQDAWTRLDHDLAHAKRVLSALPDQHVEYRTEEASETYDTAAYYRLQYILAPAILRREPVEDGYVLIEFWTTKRVVPVSGLVLIEDFGHGLGLYRRP